MTKLHDLLRKAATTRPTVQGPKSLSSYLKEAGASASQLSDTLQAITKAAQRAAPTHPAVAEELSDAGLSDSGYRDYLATAASTRQQAQTADAYADYLNDKRTAVADYKEYLSQAESERAARSSKVFTYAERMQALDTDDLTRYARLLGFDAKEAVDLAERAVTSVKEQRRSKILQTVIVRNMTGAEADAYARAIGCSEEECESIRLFADELRRAVLDPTQLMPT